MIISGGDRCRNLFPDTVIDLRNSLLPLCGPREIFPPLCPSSPLPLFLLRLLCKGMDIEQENVFVFKQAFIF